MPRCLGDPQSVGKMRLERCLFVGSHGRWNEGNVDDRRGVEKTPWLEFTQDETQLGDDERWEAPHGRLDLWMAFGKFCFESKSLGS